jgi:hypothetical protein
MRIFSITPGSAPSSPGTTGHAFQFPPQAADHRVDDSFMMQRMRHHRQAVPAAEKPGIADIIKCGL